MGMFISAETWRCELGEDGWLDLRALSYPERLACVRRNINIPAGENPPMSPDLISDMALGDFQSDDVMRRIQLDAYDLVALVSTACTAWSEDGEPNATQIAMLKPVHLRDAALEVLERSDPPANGRKARSKSPSSAAARSRNGSSASPSTTAGGAGRKT